MTILVIRHGVAEDRDAFAATGEPDTARPLTPAGRKKMKKAARGLAALAPEIDVVAASPLVRAAQTAELVVDAYGSPERVELSQLEPDAKPADLLPWLERQARRRSVAVVGHEPHLSKLVSFLLAGGRGSFVELKKGGACLLELDGAPAAGSARLLWLITPRQLRALGK